MLNNNIIWITNKVYEYLLNESPYVKEFEGLEYIDAPTIIFQRFIIVVDENHITIGNQAIGLPEKEIELLKKNLEMMVDNVEIKQL